MRADRTRWVALYVLCTGMLMIVLDISVVNVALPNIQTDLGFSSAGLAWVVNAYVISFGGLLLLVGRLGDLFGRRRLFLAGLTVFTIASVACGLAQSESLLIAARFIQGAGGAMTSSVILGLIVTMFPDGRERAQAIGVFAFVASAGGAVGLLAGGVLTQLISWHWIFFVNVPIGCATAFLARRFVAADAPGPRSSVDSLGAVLVTSALMLAVYTIVSPAAEDGWTSTRTLAFGVAGVALFGGFLAREATAGQPLMPLRIFRSRNVTGANLVQLLGASGMFGTFYLGALYAQRVLGYDPIVIGLAFLPVSVLMGFVSVRYSQRLIERFGSRRLCITGMLLISAGLALLALTPTHAQYWPHLFPALVLIGLGAGIGFPPVMGLAMSGATAADAGLASGLVNTTGQVGGALGLAVLATVTSARTDHLSASGQSLAAALTGGYHLGYAIAAILMLISALVAVTVLPGRAPVDLDVEVRRSEPAAL